MDRMIRMIIAIVFVGLCFGGVVTGVAGNVLLVLGVVFVLTSLVSFCSLYLPFGISTKKKED